MNTHTRQALETLDTAARQVAELFAKKYYECTLESEYIYNVGDDPIGVWNIGDEFWDFNDMVVALQHNADRETLMDWYYEVYAEENDDRTPFINLKSWLKGIRPKDVDERSKLVCFDEIKPIRAYSEASEIDQTLIDLIDDAIEFGHADYTGRQRTDEECQEAFNELIKQKNAILRKLKKRDSSHD